MSPLGSIHLSRSLCFMSSLQNYKLSKHTFQYATSEHAVVLPTDVER